jgi:flagellar assembly factor FliW
MSISQSARQEIFFPEGLVGCPDWQRFQLESDPATAPALILRCLDLEGLSFIVADPRALLPAYSFEVAVSDLAALEVADPGALSPLVILNIQAEPFRITANLLGPLLINPATGRARQIVQSSHNYSAAHVLLDLSAPEGQHASAHASN